MESLILTEVRNQIAYITINRPQQLNALNKDTIAALHDALKTANDDTAARVIILTGSGEKAFVAGADIKEFADFNIAQGGELAQHGQASLFDFIENLSTPVIAAVNGFALGGGLELAMSAHIRIASSNAKMGLPETSLGVIPGYGGTQRLAQLIGRGKANELIFTAGMLKAEDALQWGLVNAVVEQPKKVSNFYVGFSSLNPENTSSKLYDLELIKQDILNHCNTRKGQRVMNPTFGTIIWDLLMEPLTPNIRNLLTKDIDKHFALCHC